MAEGGERNSPARSGGSSQQSQKKLVSLGYCAACGANHGDYPETGCLCGVDSSAAKPPEDGEGGACSSARRAGSSTGDGGLTPSKTCGSETQQTPSICSPPGLQNTFDRKVQNFDTPGDVCLSKSSSVANCHSEGSRKSEFFGVTPREHSRHRPASAASVEASRESMLETVGVGTACVVTNGLLGDELEKEECHFQILPGAELGGRLPKAARPPCTDEPAVPRAAGIGPAGPSGRGRAVDVFIMDSSGKISGYEMTRLSGEDGPRVIVRKKKQRKHGEDDEELSSVVKGFEVCRRGGSRVKKKSSLSGEKYRHGDICRNRAPAAGSLDVHGSAGGSASAASSGSCMPKSSVRGAVSLAEGCECSRKPEESGDVMDLPKSCEFSSTIFFEVDTENNAFTGERVRTRGPVFPRSGGSVAKLVSFYECLAREKKTR